MIGIRQKKAVFIVSILVFGIVIAYIFCSRFEQKTPSISMTLSKNQPNDIQFDYKMLHNLYNSGGNLRIIDYVNVVSASCRSSLKNDSGIQSIVFRLNNYSELNSRDYDFLATLTVSGDFLSSTPKKQALSLISHRLHEAYNEIMRCYKNKMNRETLLD